MLLVQDPDHHLGLVVAVEVQLDPEVALDQLLPKLARREAPAVVEADGMRGPVEAREHDDVLAPLEAMAHGTPVVAARATCLPEVCADAAVYFEPSDPGCLASGWDGDARRASQ